MSSAGTDGYISAFGLITPSQRQLNAREQPNLTPIYTNRLNFK